MAFKEVLKNVVPKFLQPRHRLASEILKTSQLVIQAGPFRGMNYIHDSAGSALYPKILGTYERELAPVVEKAIRMRPELLVDVGAAEGYYAVGIALRVPKAHVIAFEMDEQGRQLLAQLAEKNDCADRIQIRGKCEIKDLEAALPQPGTKPGKTLVIVDVEGYEKILLDPSQIPGLKDCCLLVELHEFAVSGIGKLVRERFEASHKIEEIWDEPRSSKDYPINTLYARAIPGKYRVAFVDEYRPARMSWLWMEPKTASANQA